MCLYYRNTTSIINYILTFYGSDLVNICGSNCIHCSTWCLLLLNHTLCDVKGISLSRVGLDEFKFLRTYAARWLYSWSKNVWLNRVTMIKINLYTAKIEPYYYNNTGIVSLTDKRSKSELSLDKVIDRPLSLASSSSVRRRLLWIALAAVCCWSDSENVPGLVMVVATSRNPSLVVVSIGSSDPSNVFMSGIFCAESSSRRRTFAKEATGWLSLGSVKTGHIVGTCT